MTGPRQENPESPSFGGIDRGVPDRALADAGIALHQQCDGTAARRIEETGRSYELTFASDDDLIIHARPSTVATATQSRMTPERATRTHERSRRGGRHWRPM